ncbi:hypothetical protein ACFVKB_39115 [Rhodococcus sp. NPDC127530]|uniref:hypothetical protein n=1 Tax=unclassified Rhodococcus (in: high G+C Gram-positive bacteria) TaxID=192944 RepID=UPI0036386716
MEGAVMSDRASDYATGLHVELTLSHLRSVPDPVQRAHECTAVAEQARQIQGQIAAIRRHAVYEATLRPGASGESVAAELGVTPKAVSQATATYRKRELSYLKSALVEYLQQDLPAAVGREVDAALKARDVVQVARAVVRADDGRHTWDLTNEEWGFLEAAERRAREVMAIAQVSPDRPDYRPSTLADRTVDYDKVDPYLRWPVKCLNALPGIAGSGSHYRLKGDISESWMLSWQIMSAQPYTTVFEAGPHRDGWASTEWLVWFTRDLIRSGCDLETTVTSPPPYLNQPGESLSFQVFGTIQKGSLSPTQYAEKLIAMWDDHETGYVDIDWPKPESTA